MTSLSGQKDPVSPIVIGSLPARYIMTTAGNTAHAEGRVLTKSDPVTSVTGADLAADGVTRATAPVWGSTRLTCGTGRVRKAEQNYQRIWKGDDRGPGSNRCRGARPGRARERGASCRCPSRAG